MKVHFIWGLLLASVGAIAQTQVSTTEAEYTYLTKGYGPQVIEQAGDLKKGYELEELGSREPVKLSSYYFNFYSFIRTESKQFCAMLVVIKSDVSGKRYYLCIPVNNADLMARYYKDLDALDGSVNREYAKLSSTLVAQLVGLAFETEKNKK